MIARFQGMHHQHAVDRVILKRQFGFIGQGHHAGALGGPGQDTLRLRHGCQDPLGLAQELPQIRRGIAQSQQRLASQIRPHGTDPRAQQLSRNLPQIAVIKISKVDDVLPHRP